jgi:hypothetical protein
MKQAIYKVPNGKLLKLFVSFNEDSGDPIISDIKLTGDFFIYPEEKITLIEDFFKGQNLNQLSEQKSELEKLLEEHQVELFGIDIESIFLTILKAYEG